MEIVACALPVVWIGSLVAICVFCRERSTVVANKRNVDPDGAGEVFNDITDPSQFYRIQNVYYDDGTNSTSSDFDWQDTVEIGDDFSSSSMFDD